MENKIKIVDLLRKCPKGMELDCSLFDGVVLEGIDSDDSDYPIRVRTKEGEIWSVTSEGCWDFSPSARCVIFPKGRTTWQGFVPPPCFNDGDIIYVCTSMFKWISVFKNSTENGIVTYADYCLSNRRFYGINDDSRVLCQNDRILESRLATEEEKREFFNNLPDGYVWDAENKALTYDTSRKIANFNDGDLLYVKTAKGIEIVFAYRKTQDDDKYLRKYVALIKQTNVLLGSFLDAVCEINAIENIRFATDDEKEEFFSVCDKNGYKWDCENKTLKKKTEQQRSGHKFDTGTLKPFDKVLVRDGNGLWRPGFFGADMITGYRYLTSDGYYKCCIPYEGNEHLVGTTRQCDDYYKVWTD